MQRQNVKRGTRKKTIRRQSQKVISHKSNYITNYQSPESIVKILLDKIITLSIRQSSINKIDNQLNKYCFDYIKNQIEPLFEENYMSYTPSNSNINNNIHNNTDTIFWKNKKAEPNHWIEIKEPESFTNDRFEGAFAHIKELNSKNKKIKLDKIKEGLIHDNNILDKTAEKEANSTDENDKNSNKKSNRKKKTLIENSANKNNNKEENKSKIQFNNIIRKKVKKVQMVNFPSMDIPGIENEFMHEVFDPPNIDKLRKERDDEIKKKEKEKKMQIEAIKIAKKKDDNEKINKRVKPLDSNKYTFDSNGKIINFKQYKLDSLMKDFAFIKNSIKDDKVKPTKKKNISINKESAIKINEDVIKNPNNEEEKREKSHTDKNNEKKDKIIPSGSNFQIILPNIGVVIKENQKIKEGGREFNKFFNKYSIHDYDKILNEYVPLQNKTKMRNKMEIMNLTPTTTHIQKKISESVDNTRINTSQHNFSNINNTFNFNTDNINMNNPLLLNTNDNIQVNINDTDNNIINNNISSSPYLKTSINSFTKNTNNNYNPLMTSFNARSALMSFSQGKRGINMNDSIMLKKPGASLKMEIESMQDLRNETNYYKHHNIKQKNIFGKKYMKQQHRIALIKQIGNNSLASFNKSILTDANWGNQIGQKITTKDNVIIAKHHTKQQAIRELGSTFLSGIKIKLPRDRKVEINK